MVMNVLVEFADANAALVEAYILTFARMKKDGEVRLCFEWNHEMPMLEGAAASWWPIRRRWFAAPSAPMTSSIAADRQNHGEASWTSTVA